MVASFKRGSRLCRISPPLRGFVLEELPRAGRGRALLPVLASTPRHSCDFECLRLADQGTSGGFLHINATVGPGDLPADSRGAWLVVQALASAAADASGTSGGRCFCTPILAPAAPRCSRCWVGDHQPCRRRFSVAAGTPVCRIVRHHGDAWQRVLGCHDLAPDVALLALLAEARRAAEKGEDLLGLKEYLLSIPADFPMVPLTFSEEDVDLHLRGSSLLLALAAQNGQLEEEQKVALEHLPQLTAPWSIDRLRWAKAALLTRAGPCFSASTGEEAEAMQGIVPLVDFANCSADPTARCRVGTDDSIELVAARDLQAGEAVTISYGQQSQEQQIFNFGFALDSSSMDLLTPLAMVVPPEVTTAVELRSVLLKFLFLERGEQADGLGGDLPPVALLRARSLEEIDVSEMRAVANLLEMPEAELRSVADHVKSQQVLPASLKAKASPAALRRLLVLLDAWHE
ncbi:SETD3, partial [Symbiodinium sp. CCMP2456]